MQKFLYKDTETSINLNTSLGQVGYDALGDTFQHQEESMQDIAARFNNLSVGDSVAVSNRVSVASKVALTQRSSKVS